MKEYQMKQHLLVKSLAFPHISMPRVWRSLTLMTFGSSVLILGNKLYYYMAV